MEDPKTTGDCQVRVDSTPPDWRGLLDRIDHSGVYQRPEWGEVMRRAYGARPYYLTAIRAGQIAGGLVLVHQKSRLFGSQLSSVPYFDAAGVLTTDAGAAEALLAAAEGIRVECGAGRIELRQFEPLPIACPMRTDKVTLWLDIPAGSDAMWDQLRSKVRNKVRKALKSELTVSQGGPELLDDFFKAYSRTMRDLGSPPHSLRYFRLVAETVADALRIFSVRDQSRVLAGSLTLSDDHGFHVPWAGSDRRFASTGANRVLYWHMLAHAADAGAGLFDFGRSSKDSGTYEFKKEWGAREVQLYWHYLGAGAEASEHQAGQEQYSLIRSCWRKLPVRISNLVGPHIIGKLS